MRVPLLICFAIGVAHSLVEFTNSALYDIYDFKDVDEVHISKCDYGCLVFAATEGDEFVQYSDKFDPYAVNLIITDNDNGNTVSIAKLAVQKINEKKTPLTINGRGNISVVNNNEQNAKPVWTIVLYVVEKTKAEEFSYEVYDVYYNKNSKITPQSQIVTFLSAWPFTVQADASTQSNSVTARLTGFDNALDTNKDGCPYAYKTPDGAAFSGFFIASKPPIMSLVMEKKVTLQVNYELVFSAVTDMAIDGFLTSPGWNGCTNPNNGGIQSFRGKDDLPTDTVILSSNDDQFDVSMEVFPNFDAKHKLTIEDGNLFDKQTIVTGTVKQNYKFLKTQKLFIDFVNMKGDQGFLLRYSSSMIPKTSTTGITTERNTILPSDASSTTQTSPTTSSSFRRTGSLLSMILFSLLFLHA